jgi:hypothetical protein
MPIEIVPFKLHLFQKNRFGEIKSCNLRIQSTDQRAHQCQQGLQRDKKKTRSRKCTLIQDGFINGWKLQQNTFFSLTEMDVANGLISHSARILNTKAFPCLF